MKKGERTREKDTRAHTHIQTCTQASVRTNARKRRLRGVLWSLARSRDMHSSSFGSDVLKYLTCSPPASAHHASKSLSALFSCSTPTLSTSFPLYPSFPFACSAVWLLTFRQSLHVPLPLVLADAAAAAVFAPAPLPLVLAEAAAVAVFTLAPLPLVLANAAAAAVFALDPLPLALAEATAAAVFTSVPPPLVFAHALPLPRATPRALLPHPPQYWVRAQIRPIGWCHVTPVVFAAFFKAPCGRVCLQCPLLACGRRPPPTSTLDILFPVPPTLRFPGTTLLMKPLG